jgi:hypothetical protein
VRRLARKFDDLAAIVPATARIDRGGRDGDQYDSPIDRDTEGLPAERSIAAAEPVAPPHYKAISSSAHGYLRGCPIPPPLR